jgi:hypothetical protein
VERHRQQLRLVHLLVVAVATAISFAVMPPWGATIFTIGCLCGCLAVGLGLAPITDLFAMMACLFLFGCYVSNAVERAKPPPNPALQRAPPAAAASGKIKPSLGGPVR